jgi:ribosome biogenesis GTPase A
MERQLEALLKWVDVAIEVLDARLPQVTINPRLRKKLQNKPVLILLNKSDLADPAETKRWRQFFQNQADQDALLYDAHKAGQHKQALLNAVIRLGEPRMQALERKGMKRRPIRVLVIGMPNVGKSSVINSIVAKKKAKTGHKAGVTREPQWVRIHPAVELLDSPGIIPPRLDSEAAGLLLATVSSVGEAAYDEETVARFLLGHLETLYPGLLRTHYQLPESSPVTMEAIAEARHYLAAGGRIDTRRATQALLTDFRQGRLGRLTLEPYGRPEVLTLPESEPMAEEDFEDLLDP